MTLMSASGIRRCSPRTGPSDAGSNRHLAFRAGMAEARERALTSDEHFTVDGTLVEAWARLKSFKRKDASDGQIPPDDPGNPTSMVARPGMSRLPPRADTEPHRVDGMRVRSKGPLPR